MDRMRISLDGLRRSTDGARMSQADAAAGRRREKGDAARSEAQERAQVLAEGELLLSRALSDASAPFATWLRLPPFGVAEDDAAAAEAVSAAHVAIGVEGGAGPAAAAPPPSV